MSVRRLLAALLAVSAVCLAILWMSLADQPPDGSPPRPAAASAGGTVPESGDSASSAPRADRATPSGAATSAPPGASTPAAPGLRRVPAAKSQAEAPAAARSSPRAERPGVHFVAAAARGGATAVELEPPAAGDALVPGMDVVVRDDTGASVAGATVTVWIGSPDRSSDARTGADGVAVVNGEGFARTAAIASLPDGYVCGALTGGLWRRDVPSINVPVARANARVRVELPVMRAASAVIRVSPAFQGKATAWCSVEAPDGSLQETYDCKLAATDSVIEASKLPPGRVRIGVSVPDAGTGWTIVETRPGTRTEGRIELSGGDADVTLVIADAVAPERGFACRLVPAGWQSPPIDERSARFEATAGSREFTARVRRLVPGRYLVALYVDADGGWAWRRARFVDVGPGEQRIALPPPPAPPGDDLNSISVAGPSSALGAPMELSVWFPLEDAASGWGRVVVCDNRPAQIASGRYRVLTYFGRATLDRFGRSSCEDVVDVDANTVAITLGAGR